MLSPFFYSYIQKFTNSLSQTFSATKSPFRKGDFWLFSPPLTKGGRGDFQFVNFWYNKIGGERGIRTLGGAFTPHSLSRRAPSASSAISP